MMKKARREEDLPPQFSSTEFYKFLSVNFQHNLFYSFIYLCELFYYFRSFYFVMVMAISIHLTDISSAYNCELL